MTIPVFGVDANFIAVIVLSIMVLDPGHNPYSREHRAIRNMVVNIALFLILDITYQIFHTADNEVLRTVAFAAKSLYFAENSLTIYLWNQYVGYSIWDEDFYFKWYRVFFLVSLSTCLVLIILNFFKPVLFRIASDGTFLAVSAGMHIFTVLNYANVAITFISLFRNRKRLLRRNFLLLAFYPVGPLIAEIVHLFFHDIDLLSLYAMAALLITRVEDMNNFMVDPLTGIGNRLMLDAKLNKWFSVKRNDYVVGIMLDINNLKQINDTYGHPAGDDVIRRVARELAGASKKYKIFPIRYGGDEFMLLWRSATLSDVDEVVRYLKENEYRLNKGLPEERQFSYSLGLLKCGPEETMTPGDFLWLLDKKMYENKNELEQTIQYAIANNGLRMVLQPIWSTQDKCYRAAEALIRLTKEDGTEVSPSQFIPVAEKTGSIFQLDRFMLQEVCKVASRPDFEEWGIDFITLNVSSAHAFRPTLPAYVIRTLDSFGIPHERIGLELTETAVSSNREGLMQNAQELKAAGIRLILDDFGKGYSNLIRLAELPIAMTKLDRSLIASTSRSVSKILRYTIPLLHGLKQPIVAEGVETEAQMEALRDMQVQYMQGYYFAHPLPLEDFIKEVKARLNFDESGNPYQ